MLLVLIVLGFIKFEALTDVKETDEGDEKFHFR